MLTLSDSQLNLLGLLACRTILAGLEGDKSEQIPPTGDATLLALGASFVTLRKNGALRGCIGSTTAYRPLWADVEDNALGAAFRDPRFNRVHPHEGPEIVVEVSVLSPPEKLEFAHAKDLFEQLTHGRDGLIVSHQGNRATYLPGVWAQFSSSEQFVRSLCQKAGIPAATPLTQVEIERYATVHAAGRPLSSGQHD